MHSLTLTYFCSALICVSLTLAEDFLEPYDNSERGNYDQSSPMITHWPDESGMRQRLAELAKKKLSQVWFHSPASSLME